ncbi:hypothetical protein ACFQUU_02765 [Herbaspirillum sp. GCM10030257]|uniref:hypothetical protein n=1 Tax=Herbaspirillum sp. GCM10030257 TaxID=3273393 RepID=UPI00361E8FE1
MTFILCIGAQKKAANRNEEFSGFAEFSSKVSHYSASSPQQAWLISRACLLFS